MNGARTIRRGGEEWPRALDLLADAPGFLRVRGAFLGEGDRAVSVVGSRAAGPEGIELARRIGRALARAGAWVVSGGAAGVDAAAHAGAVEGGGRTAVILGGGLDHLYPAANRELFARVVETGGGLAAEVEDGMRAASWSFPKRNRIVAALGEATVVVRAGARSGALVTAQRAMRLGRPVWVAADGGPGESEGLRALGEAGARTFRSVNELVEALSLSAAGAVRREEARAAGLEGPAAAIWGALGGDPLPADDVAHRAGVGAAQALSGLMELELLGLVERRPGRGFVRRAA